MTSGWCSRDTDRAAAAARCTDGKAGCWTSARCKARASPRERLLRRCTRVNGRGIEQRNVGIPVTDQERNLRTAQNDRLCALGRQA